MIRKPTEDELGEATLKDLEIRALTGDLIRTAIAEMVSAVEENREPHGIVESTTVVDLWIMIQELRGKVAELDSAMVDTLQKLVDAQRQIQSLQDSPGQPKKDSP